MREDRQEKREPLADDAPSHGPNAVPILWSTFAAQNAGRFLAEKHGNSQLSFHRTRPESVPLSGRCLWTSVFRHISRPRLRSFWRATRCRWYTASDHWARLFQHLKRWNWDSRAVLEPFCFVGERGSESSFARPKPRPGPPPERTPPCPERTPPLSLK